MTGLRSFPKRYEHAGFAASLRCHSDPVFHFRQRVLFLPADLRDPVSRLRDDAGGALRSARGSSGGVLLSPVMDSASRFRVSCLPDAISRIISVFLLTPLSAG